MVTHVELSESELTELKEATQQTDPSEAIRVAMREFLRHARRMQLKTLPGKVEMVDDWELLEQREMETSGED